MKLNTEKALELSKKYLSSDKDDFSTQDMHVIGDLIGYHSELYYEKETPIISDSEYDTLFKVLEYLEKKLNTDISISQKVGSDMLRSSFEKVSHSRPMISLDNTYNEEDLCDFDERIKRILKSDEDLEYMIEFKFDGLGIELIYDEGKLVQAITRGNGIEGEDVTQNVMQISNIPKTIERIGRFEVRGEVVMPISSFERLNEQAKASGEKVFSNPRNAASGSLRVLDVEVTKKRDLKYFAYDVSDFNDFSQGNYDDMIHYLESLGFEISSYFKKSHSIHEVISEIENFGDTRKNVDFEIDGLVIKINTMSLWKKIGYTQHHPRYAIAYKFPAEIVTTKIISVEHSLGRTGTITPVANLEPVNIGGAIIRRATLHNYEEVEKLGVKVGDSVFLKRAGEVIPKIISVAVSGDGKIISVPELCPSCGSEIIKDEDKVRYYCPNSYGCPAQISEKLTFAVSKQGFNIDGFGEKQAQLFYKLGFIKHVADIFRLHRYREEILALEGFKEKSVNNLLSGIEKVRKVKIEVFLTSLGIPGVGKKTAKTLASLFHTVEELDYNFLPQISEIENLPDIGPEVAKSFSDFFKTQSDEINDLLGEIEIIFLNTQQITHGKYSGKKMCITGSFDGYSRDELVEILEKQGGQFSSSVSKNTDYLLAGEKAGGKLKKAQELGVEILSLDDFLR